MSDLHSLFPELGRWGTAGAVGAREHTEAGQRRGELGPAWWGATSRRCRFRCGRRSRCAVGLVEVEVFRRRPAGTRSAVRSPVPSPAKSPPAQAGIPFQPPEPIPHGGTAIDGAAAMTLVQVKRPYRRPDTAEVIPTVTREVDDEGATKPVEVMMRGQGRGPNPPSAGPGSTESGRHRSDHHAGGTAPRTRGTTTTRQLPGLEAGHPLEILTRDWSHGLGEEAMSRTVTSLTICQDWVGQRLERQTSRPVRRVLSPGRLAAAGETAIHLGPALLPVSCGLPANSGGQPSSVRAGPSCGGPS
ncbi:hypothetical protein SAMN02745898_104419 [Streptomyces sp. 136MFCol5.1]|nr:hypothetical protein SAMN02745898_104419 [Streptomyces sp. 136MFCol5.1]